VKKGIIFKESDIFKGIIFKESDIFRGVKQALF